ncbi:relaxase/mobilization nuclease domain-containing protein [Rhizobium fabae]|uniref:MobA/VirD2-like nuclease domain-containing protein n=1 Tax=Rhizobium fabae TaxID=573179 RepID=A0A7W6FIU0_9HYPH|nr:hypothetical protein [Rhizobium fabae]MBB3915573.1 hypothetical protein [Rhizobium fabae]RUM11846.1 hypothetical protein EFB14_15775 [Rhizobium fabae]
MIGGIGRHGRTKRDSRNLATHLLKESGATVEIVNSVAPDLRAVMSDMELARDGTTADAAFLHVFISPSRDMSRDELRQAGELVLRHFGAEEHQTAFVYHDKPRQGGEGGRHLHMVVGRVGPEGNVLPSGFEIIRMETAMRMAEFELGEIATLGRHHVSGIRWLRANGRADVADWLEAAHGPDPDKPTSAASPSKRQTLARKGIELADAADIVRSAWAASDGGRSFAAALRADGLDVVPGEKTGVFVIRQGAVEIGALDRIVKLKRREVAARMEGFENELEENQQSDGGLPDRVPGSPECDGGSREAGALASAPGQLTDGGAVADRAASGGLGIDPDEPAPATPVDAGVTSESRRRHLDEARWTTGLKGFSITAAMRTEMDNVAIRQLDTHSTLLPRLLSHQLVRLDWGRIRELAEDLRRFINIVRRKIRFGDRPKIEPQPRYSSVEVDSKSDAGFAIHPR